MNSARLRSLFTLSLFAVAPLIHAQDADSTNADAAAAEMSFVDELASLGVQTTEGPAQVMLGSIAEIDLPPGALFIGQNSVERYFELTQNSYAGNEVGVLISDEGWTMFFDYDAIGYVKDDEKDSLDADELMDSMVSNQEAANQSRIDRGWDAMKMQGWATKPYYDPNTNNLKWAFNLSSSQDNFQEIWINESIRLLGRSGVMNVILVTGPENFAAAEASADGLLASNFNYVVGERYTEFKEGDKIAEYGLAALVLGGAGVMAAKSGLLAKFWKFIVFGLIALAGFFRKIWNGITGKNPRERDSIE
jgi:uncharacterized membrane-anchored protein